MVLGDSFGQSVFTESLCRVFRRKRMTEKVSAITTSGETTDALNEDPDAGSMIMAFGATLEILTSRDFKVSGAIGAVTSMHKRAPNVSDVVVGVGETNIWSLGGIDNSTTVVIYFDVNPSSNSNKNGANA